MIAARALRDAVARLRAAGVDDPAGDARRLLAHHAGDLLPSEALPDPQAWAALVARRAARTPMAQILGRRAFWRHDFAVTPDVLDPRPETETLVAAALDGPFSRVIDLGTGSGAILLSLMAERPRAAGTGTDLSEAALAVARGNARALGLRPDLIRADWWGGVEGTFDLVVSNPPYIAEAEMAGLAPELAHEPRMALTPGGDGLEAYRAIAAGLGAHLAPGGRVIVEIGPTQGAAVSALLRGAGLAEVAVGRDLDGRNRIVSGRKSTE